MTLFPLFNITTTVKLWRRALKHTHKTTMDAKSRSWGGHYSRYHQDPDKTVELAEINRLRNEHEYMEKGWQHVEKYHKVRHVPTACCVQTGLRVGAKTPKRKCNLEKIEDIFNTPSMVEHYGEILPEDCSEESSVDLADDEDDECHYGVHLCMAF